MTEKTLPVAEVFYSLQCEGRAIGTPAVFLRLGGCNLLCQSKTWVCDTIEVWKHAFTKKFEDVIKEEWVAHLKEGAHLVITGGEPLLHQEAIVKYLVWFYKTYQFHPFVEVETNGTILPSVEMRVFANWWNVSPKLSNSGMPAYRRINEVAIRYFLSTTKAIFKFVVSCDEDLLEMGIDYAGIPFKAIYLMPAGGTQEELNAVRLWCVEACIRLTVHYSERLHIVIWNKKTGV